MKDQGEKQAPERLEIGDHTLTSLRYLRDRKAAEVERMRREIFDLQDRRNLQHQTLIELDEMIERLAQREELINDCETPHEKILRSLAGG